MNQYLGGRLPSGEISLLNFVAILKRSGNFSGVKEMNSLITDWTRALYSYPVRYVIIFSIRLPSAHFSAESRFNG